MLTVVVVCHDYGGKGTVLPAFAADPSVAAVQRPVWSLDEMLEELKLLIELRDEIQRQRKEYSKLLYRTSVYSRATSRARR